MTRRHNRHFRIADDLTMCSGATKYYFFQCHNWGKPDETGAYWCHIHLVQKPAAATNDRLGK